MKKIFSLLALLLTVGILASCDLEYVGDYWGNDWYEEPWNDDVPSASVIYVSADAGLYGDGYSADSPLADFEEAVHLAMASGASELRASGDFYLSPGEYENSAVYINGAEYLVLSGGWNGDFSYQGEASLLQLVDAGDTRNSGLTRNTETVYETNFVTITNDFNPITTNMIITTNVSYSAEVDSNFVISFETNTTTTGYAFFTNLSTNYTSVHSYVTNETTNYLTNFVLTNIEVSSVATNEILSTNIVDLSEWVFTTNTIPVYSVSTNFEYVTNENYEVLTNVVTNYVTNVTTATNSVTVTNSYTQTNEVVVTNVVYVTNETSTGGGTTSQTYTDGTGRLFYIVNSEGLDIYNFVMCGADVDGDYGYDTCGGAVYLDQCEFVSLFCDFYDNVANQGGAVYARRSTNVMINGDFSRNYASLDGGALCLFGLIDSTVSVTATSNRAANSGGAMFLNCNCRGNVIDGEFTYNVSDGNGGAMTFYSNARNSILGGTIIENNVCDANDSGFGWGGGVLLESMSENDIDIPGNVSILYNSRGTSSPAMDNIAQR